MKPDDGAGVVRRGGVAPMTPANDDGAREAGVEEWRR